jgi:hypothetical protein
MLTFTFTGSLRGLPSKKNVTTFEDSIYDTIEADMHSFVGFAFTIILGGLAREAMLCNRKYSLKAIYYWLCGLCYIYSSLIFCLMVYFFYVFTVWQHRECYYVFIYM